ncbi:MAG: energy transducer TonB, partial [Longimicrobiales bacterium]
VQVVALRATPPAPEEPIVPVPVPAPVPEPEPEPEPEVTVESPQIDAEGTPGLLGEGATDEGPGTEEGTGQGDAGTTEEGRLRVQPPTPRGLILPPSDRPRSVRGKEVAVWVFVSVRGEVVEDSTRIIPSSGDRGFDERLRELATEWVFNPAMKAGSPVPEWFRYILVL